MACHPHGFIGICLQPHLVKNYRQHINLGLDPPRVSGCHHPVLCVEKICLHLQPCMSLLCPPSSVVAFLYHPARRLCHVVIASVPPDLSYTNNSQCQTTVFTTTFNMTGNSGPPCVTPISLWRGSPQYPPARVTICSCSQYRKSRRRDLDPTSYTSRMSSHMDLFKASYALCRSRKIMWRTSSLMVVTC